ncbi:MAG: hypothetical protein M1820_000107 [Bogoriella megaspora]|nr:MAG: hypothetical protein M1820_000107 [Bogoriella megaspora]
MEHAACVRQLSNLIKLPLELKHHIFSFLLPKDPSFGNRLARPSEEIQFPLLLVCHDIRESLITYLTSQQIISVTVLSDRWRIDGIGIPQVDPKEPGDSLDTDSQDLCEDCEYFAYDGASDDEFSIDPPMEEWCGGCWSSSPAEFASIPISPACYQYCHRYSIRIDLWRGQFELSVYYELAAQRVEKVVDVLEASSELAAVDIYLEGPLSGAHNAAYSLSDFCDRYREEAENFRIVLEPFRRLKGVRSVGIEMEDSGTKELDTFLAELRNDMMRSK